MVHTDNSVTIDVNTADVIQSVSISNIDVSVLPEQITKTVTFAVMDNLQAAGFFGHEHSQVSCFTNQLSYERQISSVVAGIINIILFTSEASSVGWDQWTNYVFIYCLHRSVQIWLYFCGYIITFHGSTED